MRRRLDQHPHSPLVTVGLGSHLPFSHLRRAPRSRRSTAHSTARSPLLGTFSARAVELSLRVFVIEYEDRLRRVLREYAAAIR